MSDDALMRELEECGAEAMAAVLALRDAGLIPEQIRPRIDRLYARFEAIKTTHAASEPK